MDVWAHKDAFEDLQKHLDHTDVAQLRAVCRDWQGVVDSTLSRLAPVNLDCPLLRSRCAHHACFHKYQLTDLLMCQ